ncbi:HU family DNA-binding protein, partial [Cutibacterium acnes]
MTKSELIKAIAKKSSLTEAQTNDAVKALTDVITEALASGDKV